MQKLRDYQEDILFRLFEHWKKNPDHNVMIQAPTGSGKGTIIPALIKILMEKEGKIIVQVHRKELVSQLSLSLSRFGIIHNLIVPTNTARQIIATQRQEIGKSFYNHASNVIIASVDTINSRYLKLMNVFKGIKYVITDEAAHVLKENKWGRALKLFPNTVNIGFTATPERLDKKGLGSWNHGVYDHIILGPRVKELIAQGYLSHYKIVAPPSDFEKHLGHVKNLTSDFSSAVIKAAAKKSRIVGDVFENYMKFAKGTQAILFAPTIEVGKEMEKEFNDNNVPCKFLSSLNTDAERHITINDFKSNKINVLINVDLFDEGLDIGAAEGRRIIETVILARPTMSLGKCLQQVGRGLRPSPNKPHAIIIDHVGNIKRHGLPCTDRKWSLEPPGKRSISKVRTCHSCLAIYERFLKECPYCGAVPEVKSNGEGRTPPEFVDGDLILIDPDTISELELKTRLETPEQVAQRVTAAAGLVAGKSAYKKQSHRIAVQVRLRDTIATWAGKVKSRYGISDREIHKMFYSDFGCTINQALAVPALQMEEYIKEIGNGQD